MYKCSQPKDQTACLVSSALVGGFFTNGATWEAPNMCVCVCVCVCIFETSVHFQGFPVAQMVKNLPEMQETQVQTLGWENPLEKGMAIHASILAWRIPWTEESGRLQSTGSQ